jgi:hypothetical protein
VEFFDVAVTPVAVTVSVVIVVLYCNSYWPACYTQYNYNSQHIKGHDENKSVRSKDIHLVHKWIISKVLMALCCYCR